MSEEHSTTPAASGKPAKPSPDFPLTPHRGARQWCKKIRGRLHYFGSLDDPQAALAKYLEQKQDLHAGRTPRPDRQALTVQDISALFLSAKDEAVEAGELSPRTRADYGSIMRLMVQGLGKNKPVNALDPQDFAALKNALAKNNGPARMCTVVQVIRCAFKFAYDSGLLDKPMRFGPAFKRTSKKTLRLHRAKQGPKLFTAAEVRALVYGALVVGKDGPELVRPGAQLKAMLLLGVNCGFGNADCGRLPLSAVNLDAGMIDFPRPKTGIARRCALWPETVEAVKDALAHRPEPKDAADAGLVFITKYGHSWFKTDSAGPVIWEVRKLLNKLGINGRKGLGFYPLRHVFRTVADKSKDQPTVDYCMGHEVAHMASHYRECIDDERLRAVAGHVRAWLFAEDGGGRRALWAG